MGVNENENESENETETKEKEGKPNEIGINEIIKDFTGLDLNSMSERAQHSASPYVSSFLAFIDPTCNCNSQQMHPQTQESEIVTDDIKHDAVDESDEVIPISTEQLGEDETKDVETNDA